MEKPTKREGILIILFIVITSVLLLTNQIFKKNSDLVIADTESSEENYLEIENNNIEEYKIEENNEKEQDEIREIFVDICGAVYDSKVVKLKDGDRVIDAVKLAGGLTDKADIKRINLAKLLNDGEKIIIPEIGEILNNNESFIENNIEASDTKVNINTGSTSQLQTLNGIGAVYAGRIIEYRERRNGFKSLEEIKEVSGIGEKTYEGIKDSIKLY